MDEMRGLGLNPEKETGENTPDTRPRTEGDGRLGLNLGNRQGRIRLTPDPGQGRGWGGVLGLNPGKQHTGEDKTPVPGAGGGALEQHLGSPRTGRSTEEVSTMRGAHWGSTPGGITVGEAVQVAQWRQPPEGAQ